MRRIAVILLTFAAVVLPCSLSAQNKDSKKEKLQKEIAILNSQLKENARKSSSALGTLTLTRKKVSARKELIKESERELSAIDDSIRTRQAEIDKIQARYDTLSFYYDRLVRNAYKNRDSRVWYMYILSSGSLNQGFRRYGYLRNLSTQMSSQAARLKDTKAELEARKAAMEEMRARATAMRDLHKKELSQLQSEEKDSEKIVAQLKRDRKKYQKELAAKKKQVEALNQKVGKMIASSSTPGKSSKPVDVKLSNEFAANKGKLPWPVEGSVVDTFGEHYHPVYKTVKMPFNNGVGIATAAGAKVKAVFDGVVKQIIVMPGYNQCILVQHGGYFTFYCKLSSVSVKAGDKVSTGQIIGTVDTIGGETQLHFELWESKKPQNPEKWLY